MRLVVREYAAKSPQAKGAPFCSLALILWVHKSAISGYDRPADPPPAILAHVMSPTMMIGTPKTARLAAGTHSLHRLLSHSSRQELLRLAFDLGIRHFDTAPSYGAGLAERELGRFARGRRDSLILASKFGIAPDRWTTVLPGGVYLAVLAGKLLRASRLRRSAAPAVNRDYSVAALERSVEASLRRLRTDYLDILFLHAPLAESLIDGERLVRSLEALRGAGKVRRFGLSGNGEHCGAIAQRYPALAEILQIDVPADPDGLPSPQPLPSWATIGLWDAPASAAHLPAATLQSACQRLIRAMPAGLILVSAHQAPVLRMAAKLLAG